MLEKLFKKPVELNIGDQILQFYSATDVAFCLEGRTSVSSKKLSELFELSAEELEVQARKLKGLNKSMFKILNSIVDDPHNIDRSMRELDTQMFSQDQNWRDIIQSLNKQQSEINDIRLTVIMKYMKYLSALEETIDYIHSGMKKIAMSVPIQDENHEIDFGATWSISHLHDEIEAVSQAQNEFKRLPKNQAVSVQVEPGRQVEILLASYPCQIVIVDGNVKLNNSSGTTALVKGKNTIGRSVKSTVKIDSGERQVSRTHLSIEIDGSNKLHLTDHSTEGTFISSDFS